MSTAALHRPLVALVRAIGSCMDRGRPTHRGPVALGFAFYKKYRISLLSGEWKMSLAGDLSSFDWNVRHFALAGVPCCPHAGRARRISDSGY